MCGFCRAPAGLCHLREYATAGRSATREPSALALQTIQGRSIGKSVRPGNAGQLGLEDAMPSWVVFQKWRWPCLHCPSKGIAVDKQANDDVVHLGRFRKADGSLLSAKFEQLDDLESRFQADLDNICETFNIERRSSPDYSPTPKIDEREGFCCQDNPHSNLVTGSSRA